jgi:hypothetical protein
MELVDSAFLVSRRHVRSNAAFSLNHLHTRSICITANLIHREYIHVHNIHNLAQSVHNTYKLLPIHVRVGVSRQSTTCIYVMLISFIFLRLISGDVS